MDTEKLIKSSDRLFPCAYFKDGETHLMSTNEYGIRFAYNSMEDYIESVGQFLEDELTPILDKDELYCNDNYIEVVIEIKTHTK